MAQNIPSAGGVPGISGPPDWLSATPNFDLDDVRWRGATKRTFGSGSSGSNFFRAVQAVVGGQQFLYLTFRAAFVQALSDQNDIVYFGVQRSGGPESMVVRMQVHPASFTPAGPPSANPPANIPSTVQIWTRASAATSWTLQPASPTWIAANARAWLQSASDDPVDDPNNRWAIQLRVPVNAAGNIFDNAGPNLGTDFIMWYLIHGTLSTGAPVILADYRTSGTTTEGNLITSNFPAPSVWDQFLISSGPGSFGGVAINWGDIVVRHGAVEDWTIHNGETNTFVARPRNYRPNQINAGDINATFRIANWGSVAGDPWQIDFSNSEWSLVPGVQPVNSNAAIPPLPAGNNPPATTPISHDALMNLPAGKSLHQCVLVTLSGNNLNFLNDSIYQNMNYDHTSLVAAEAQLSVVGLAPFSPQPRDVYLAVEKVNMIRNAPAGTNEGRFLDATIRRLMQQGGALAGKLRTALAILSDSDQGSGQAFEALMNGLRQSLEQMKYDDPAEGGQRIEQLLEALSRWLTEVKHPDGAVNQPAVDRLAALFDALANWLEASGVDSLGKLTAFVNQLNQWLGELPNDPASSNFAPPAMEAFLAWLAATVDGDRLTGPLAVVQEWFSAGRPADRLPQVISAFAQFLQALNSGSNKQMAPVAAAFARGAAAWLRGEERLGAFVTALSEADLTDSELDQVFPTIRIHPYYDTGERVAGPGGTQLPVLRAQSTFGIYAYHEGELDGWQTSLQGATRIADNLYLLAVPNNGSAKVTVKVQAVEPGEQRMPDDPIKPPPGDEACGCLCQILRLFGIGKK